MSKPAEPAAAPSRFTHQVIVLPAHSGASSGSWQDSPTESQFSQHTQEPAAGLATVSQFSRHAQSVFFMSADVVPVRFLAFIKRTWVMRLAFLLDYMEHTCMHTHTHTGMVLRMFHR